MAESYLLAHSWIAALAWIVMYTGDYYFTLWGSKLSSAQRFIEYEGSYELTPAYQDDIDKQRKFSPRFFIWLISGAFVLMAPGYMDIGVPYVYGILVGYVILPELYVHLRHLNSITNYRWLLRPSHGISGKILLPRSYMYHQSFVSLAGFAVFIFLIFALTNSPILLGGGLCCLIHAYHHFSLARRFNSNTAPESTSEPEPPNKA